MLMFAVVTYVYCGDSVTKVINIVNWMQLTTQKSGIFPNIENNYGNLVQNKLVFF